MNGNWQGMTEFVSLGVPIMRAQQTLAQVRPTEPQPLAPITSAGYWQGIAQNLGEFVPSLLAAIAILIIGVLIALIAAAIVRGILNRTNIDNKIAGWVTGDPRQAPKVEDWISGAVFWIIIVFTVVAVLQILQLEAVSRPLNNFLERVIGFLPNLLGAIILLVIAWLLASVVKLLVTRALKAFHLDERLGQHMGDDRAERASTTTPPGTVPPTTDTSDTRSTPPRTDSFSLSETIGSALYWFIFLLFLPAILSTLGLEGTLLPVQELLNRILAVLPNLLAAIVIAAAGWLVAQVVRRIVTNLLVAAGTDRMGRRFGLNQGSSGQSLSWIIGTIVYVLILIPTAIAALNALQIEAISGPAILMLTQILNALPLIFTAALILCIAYFIGHFVAELVTNILKSLGFDNVFDWIGLPALSPSRRAPPSLHPDATTLPDLPPPPQPGQETRLQQPQTPPIPKRSPSELVGIIAWVGIMLFATVAATNVLQFAALTAIVTGIVIILGQILAGLIVFAVGLYLANLAYNLITSPGSRQSQILGQAARIAIIALVSAMALQQMGIASSIVNLAFGLLLGAIAVATALAFGLGGRDIAANQVREWLSSFKKEDQTPPRY
ncbi:MAG: mechanosensitive ion channel [Kastovskya adunca ATA6-11-RM4]|jgi:hypothetical protein|nr:mechanosensitive ion channel [Kastovskya adunca ATA6-11-RM4]